MSSELAGELGQVSLTIVGESTLLKTHPQETVSYIRKDEGDQEEKINPLLVDVPQLQEVRIAAKRSYHRERLSRTSTNRPKRFRQAWMMYDIFKDWLRPHALPEFATCIACNRVIKAGKSELEKHAVGKKHLRMLKSAAGGENTSQDPDSAPLPTPASTAVVLLGQEVSSQDFSVCVRTSLFNESGYSGLDPKEVEISSDHQEFSDSANEVTSQPRVTSVQPEQGTGAHSSPSVSSGVSLSFSSSPISTPNPPITMNNQSTVTTQHNRIPDNHHISKAFVTKPAPPWKATAIVNGHVTRLDLSDYKGRYLILFFYPQDFSKLCASEVNILSDRINEFRVNCTEIVACSVDSHLSHLAWSKTPRSEGGIGNPKIPIIADPTHTIAKDYGVFMSDKGHSLRAHFIIDRRGILRHMSVNDVDVGRGTDELMRIVKALQYIDENEEVCLADWKPVDE